MKFDPRKRKRNKKANKQKTISLTPKNKKEGKRKMEKGKKKKLDPKYKKRKQTNK